MPEAKIGKYTIVGEIGRGAMGIVYKAIDPFIGRTVAIKTIRFDLLGTGPERDIAQKRFVREAHSAGNLSHPNIVTIYDVGEDQGLSYIAMEYVDGSSLDELMHASQKFSLEEILSLIEQVAEGLESAHKKGVVHRDIKPANILIGSDGRPRIVDFGIARISTSTMTQTNMIMGTPYYMSPEQISGRRVDNRADIFALGGIFYELLTGQKPFPGDNLTTVIYKIINEEPMPVRSFHKSLPEGLDFIVSRALAKSPDDRYQTCREMITDMQNYPQLKMPAPAVSSEAPTIALPAPQPILRKRPPVSWPVTRRKTTVIVLASILAVGAVAVGAILLFSRGSGNSPLLTPPQAAAPAVSAAATEGPETLLDRGRRLGNEQKYPDALAVLERIPESASQYFDSRLIVGSVLEAQDHPGLAAGEYRRLIGLNPKDPRPYLHLGQLEEHRNDLAAALGNYRKFIEISPEGVDAEGIRWKIKTIEARTRPAVVPPTGDASIPPRQAQTAATNVPAKPEAKVTAGKPQTSGAAPATKTGSPSGPVPGMRAADIAPMLEAGKRSFEKKNYAQAVQQLKPVLDLDPGNKEAKSYFDAAQKKLEEETLQATIKKELEQARAAMRSGDYAEAIVQSRRALALDEGLGDAKKIISAAVIKSAPSEIKAILDQYLQASRQTGLKSFYSLKCTPELFQRIHREAEVISATYDDIQISGSNLDVSAKESQFDRYEAEAAFTQVMTGMSKNKGTRQILFEGKMRWSLINSGGDWRISEITAIPRNKR